MLGFAILALACALLPALVAWVNLSILRTPEPDLDVRARVSVLIPARNEAAVIAATVRAALSSAGVALEVLVGDDHSTDDTAAIVAAIDEANAERGAELAFGRPLRALPRLDRAETILCVGADPLGAGPDQIRLARAFAGNADRGDRLVNWNAPGSCPVANAK